jgi:D-lactate dehydrogenase
VWVCVAALHVAGAAQHACVACMCRFNNVDLAAARRCGVRVVRVPAYSPNAVAEHTLALILALNRNIPRAYNRVRDRNFSLSGLVGFDLAGKTVGVVGTGKIGTIVARLLWHLRCKVLAVDARQVRTPVATLPRLGAGTPTQRASDTSA